MPSKYRISSNGNASHLDAEKVARSANPKPESRRGGGSGGRGKRRQISRDGRGALAGLAAQLLLPGPPRVAEAGVPQLPPRPPSRLGPASWRSFPRVSRPSLGPGVGASLGAPGPALVLGPGKRPARNSVRLRRGAPAGRDRARRALLPPELPEASLHRLPARPAAVGARRPQTRGSPEQEGGGAGGRGAPPPGCLPPFPEDSGQRGSPGRRLKPWPPGRPAGTPEERSRSRLPGRRTHHRWQRGQRRPPSGRQQPADASRAPRPRSGAWRGWPCPGSPGGAANRAPVGSPSGLGGLEGAGSGQPGQFL